GLNSYVMAVSNSAEQVTNSWGDFSGKGVPGFKTGTATNLAFMVLDNTANNSSWFYLSDVTNYFIDDTTPPEISFSQTNTWFSSTVTLTNNISEDFSGFSSNTVHVYTNNDLLNCYTNGTISGSIPLFSYHFTVVTTLLTNGTNSLTFIVSNDSTNGAGSVATNTSPLAVDNEKPVINSADYDSMISNGYLTGLSINSSDGFSGVAAYITGLSNGSLTTNSFPVSDPLFIDDFTSAPTNISNLVIYLLDNAGNPSLPYYTGPVTNSKIEDTTPPLVYISNTNQWYADTMLLNGQVEEDLSAVLNSELYIYTNNDLVNTFATLPLSGSLPLYSFSTNINTSLFPDGTNSFHFIVYNETNLMTNITYNILIDNSTPVISALPTNYSLNAATNITLNITDTFSGVSNFSYTLLNSNGSTNSLLYTNITQLLLDNAGTNYIEVTALDRAGNSSSNSFTYYLNPASSALPGLDDLPPPEESLILAQGYSDDELEYLVTNNNNSGGATIITEPDQLVSVVLLAAGKMITLKSAAIVSKHGVRVLSQDINESYNNAKAFFWDKTDNNKQRVRTGIYYIFIVYEADNKEKTASYVVVVSN
ncbi:MAG TPA: hypothetical protein VKS21_11745, partial [Spirochaetota bacterium]|nr:hypothetical protein [Spirochaetota bacterium]